ncbi:hypothetical protein [Vitiosangium sp. GDMCC 1.1324]|nr:hypothetical protein [Vitiosangium sp. GDMCC 1.1324]
MTLNLLLMERPNVLVTVAVMVTAASEGVEPQAGAVQVTALLLLVFT